MVRLMYYLFTRQKNGAKKASEEQKKLMLPTYALHTQVMHKVEKWIVHGGE